MNLDELKSTWKQYDSRLQATQIVNEKIILSMIAERSGSRFLKVKRNYMAVLIWMCICILFGGAVLLGNPFDYELPIQYIPIVVYCFCMIILTVAMVHSYISLQNISINHNNLQVSLEKIISIYEKPRRFVKYTLIVFLFTQIFLFPLSFLPRSIERMGLWPALAERLIPITIASAIFFIAFKLGAFKEQRSKKFRDDLSELEELRAVSRELIN